MTPLALLNSVLQLFFIRLARVFASTDTEHTDQTGWCLIVGAVPFTEWTSDSKCMGKELKYISL